MKQLHLEEPLAVGRARNTLAESSQELDQRLAALVAHELLVARQKLVDKLVHGLVERERASDVELLVGGVRIVGEEELSEHAEREMPEFDGHERIVVEIVEEIVGC